MFQMTAAMMNACVYDLLYLLYVYYMTINIFIVIAIVIVYINS